MVVDDRVDFLPQWLTEQTYLLQNDASRRKKQQQQPRAQGNVQAHPFTHVPNQYFPYQDEQRPHRIRDPERPSGYRLAQPGEEDDQSLGYKAEPYRLCCTGGKWYEEFGHGVSLYFKQVLWLAGMFFVAGCLSIPAIAYNLTYFPWNWLVDQSIFPPGTYFLTLGSAIAARREDLDLYYNGIPAITVVVVLLIGSIISHHSERKAHKAQEEGAPHVPGYTVCITNPIEGERDPDAYMPILRQYGEVVMITMALDNGSLLRHLVQERELEDKYPTVSPGTIEGYKCSWFKLLLHFLSCGLWSDGDVALCQWAKLSRRVDGMVADPEMFKVRKIYVVFNTEASQRACLMGMVSGRLGGSSRIVFRGRTLRMVKPHDPHEIIWENVHYGTLRRLFWRLVTSTIVTAFVGLSFLFQLYLTGMEQEQLGVPPAVRDNYLTNARLVLLPLSITVVNYLLPGLVTTVVRALEIPETKSKLQESITFKLVVARCVNTAVLLYLATPYAQMMRPRSVACVAIVMLVDWLYPLLAPFGFPRLFGPCFDTSPRPAPPAPQSWELHERYTDLVKIIFLGLFFTAIMPASLFITSLALVVKFWVDKARLFRASPPPLETRQPWAVRDFLAVCLLVHTIMSRSMFANWPFRSEGEQVWCGPMCASRFFTEDQRDLVRVFDVLVWIAVLQILQHKSWRPIRAVWNYITCQSLFRGHPSIATYRSLANVAAYVPTIQPTSSDLHCGPFLATDVDYLPGDYVPVHSASLLLSDRKLDPKLFSSVKFYPSRSPVRTPTGSQAGGSRYGSYAVDLFGRTFPNDIM